MLAGCRTDLELEANSDFLFQVDGREKDADMSLFFLLHREKSDVAAEAAFVADLTVSADSFHPSQGSDCGRRSARPMSSLGTRGTNVYRVALTQPCFLDQRRRLLHDPIDFESLQDQRCEHDTHEGLSHACVPCV
jgi:hypothetical protein